MSGDSVRSGLRLSLFAAGTCEATTLAYGNCRLNAGRAVWLASFRCAARIQRP